MEGREMEDAGKEKEEVRLREEVIVNSKGE